MPGPERIVDTIEKQLKEQAKAQLDVQTAVLRAATQQQLSQQLTELGIKRAMAETETEAQANAPTEQAPQPFRLSDLSAIREQKISPQQPMQQVNPAQLTETLGQMGQAVTQGGQPLPSAAQGLPVAGGEIVTRTQDFGVSPERVGQQGFIMVPNAQERVTRTPNALTAQDLARLRQSEQQFGAAQTAEEQRFQQTERRLRAGQFTQAYQELASEGVEPQRAAGLAQAIASGNVAQVEELAKGLPKTLSARQKESAIRVNEMNARLAQARMAAELAQLGQSRTRLDLLAGWQNYAGEDPPSMEQLRQSLRQGLDEDNKVLLRDAQIGYLARGQAVFLEASGLSKLWGGKDARGLDAYEVVGRISQYQNGSATEAQEAQKALEELGFEVRAVRLPDGSAVAELQPPAGLDEDLGRGLLRIARGERAALAGGKSLVEVAPAPSDPGEEPPQRPPRDPVAGIGGRQTRGTQTTATLEALRSSLEGLGRGQSRLP